MGNGTDNRLEAALDSLQESFAFFDAEDRLVFFNEKYLRAHSLSGDLIKQGVRFEDIIRTNVERGNVADAIGREEEFIRERMEQHRNPKGPFVRQLTNGNSLLINESRTPDGGTCQTMTDITQLRRAEEALSLSQSRLQGAIDSLLEGFCLYDADDRLIAANEYYLSHNPNAEEVLERGGTFEDLLRAQVGCGKIPEAHGH